MNSNYKKGQKAYVWVFTNYPRDGRSEYDERNLRETTVLSVGSKYITTDYYGHTKYDASHTICAGCNPEIIYGHTGLFLSKEAALEGFDKLQKIEKIKKVFFPELTKTSIDVIYEIIMNDENIKNR